MILITGATGLVGTHLLAELLPDHSSILALYRSEEKKNQALQVLSYYGIPSSLIEERLQWEKVDILDLVTLKNVFGGVKKVYHCAALVSFHRLDYQKLLEVNVQGTANVVNMCLHFGIEKLVHMSSVAALGSDKMDEYISEKSKWTSYDGKSGYAISKKHGENEVWRGVEEGLSAIVVQPTIIFGAAPLTQSSIAIFKTVLKGQPFYTKGTNAIVDARDVARIMHQLMESNKSNEAYLLVGENTSFKTIMDVISEEGGVRKPRYAVSSRTIVLMAKVMEQIGRWIGVKPALSHDSAKAAVASIRYCNGKVKNELSYTFLNLHESVKNVLLFHHTKR